MTESRLPPAARAVLHVRVLNQIGAFALGFLAVLAGPGRTTVVLAVFGVAALLSRWAGAMLLDRCSPRVVITCGLAATGVSLTVLAAARTHVQLLAAVAAVGLAFEIYEAATAELLARVTTGEQRQLAYTALGTWLVAAEAVAGLIAAVLFPFGVRWLLIADAATCLVAAAVAWFGLAENVPRGSVRGSVRSRGGPAGGSGRRWRPPARLVTLTLGATAYAFGHLAVMMFVPLALLQRGGPDWLPGLALTCAALAAPAAGKAAARTHWGVSRTVSLIGGTVVLGTLALAMAGTGDVTATVVIYLLWAVAGSLSLGQWPAMVADIAPAADRPRWFAFLGLSWGIAQPAVPGVVGLAAGPAGGTVDAALLAAGAAFLVVPLVLAVSGGVAGRPGGPLAAPRAAGGREGPRPAP